MAYVYNPYGGDTGLGSAISQAMGTFARMQDDASTRALREAQIQDVQSEIQQRRHEQRMGDALATAYGAGAPVNEILAASTRAGPDYLKLAPSSYLAGVANRPGSTNDERLAAFVGAGGAPTPDNAFTPGRQDAISARNAAEDYALGTARASIAAGPGHARVAELRRQFEVERADAAAAEPDPVTLSSGQVLVNPATGQRLAFGAGIDPATGAPRPESGKGREFGRLEEAEVLDYLLAMVPEGVSAPPKLLAQAANTARDLFLSGEAPTLVAAAEAAAKGTWIEEGAGWGGGPLRLEPVGPGGPAAPAASGQVEPSGPPRPGHVETDDEGRKWQFRGGDPANPDNWVPMT